MMRDCSPLLLELGEDDPGIIVTQSVHKQQAGFSQASQIHKKDAHIKGQKRYVNHDRFNNAFMMQASTSPFYPIFASLDVNAQMHADGSGERLWETAVEIGIEARKLILANCTMIRPFVPERVDGALVAGRADRGDREPTASSSRSSRASAGTASRATRRISTSSTPTSCCSPRPGLDTATGEYEDFGIPANILANYLRENGIVPEKCDLNSILFLLTPAETIPKMQNLVAQLMRFEELIGGDAPLEHGAPGDLPARTAERYARLHDPPARAGDARLLQGA